MDTVTVLARIISNFLRDKITVGNMFGHVNFDNINF